MTQTAAEETPLSPQEWEALQAGRDLGAHLYAVAGIKQEFFLACVRNATSLKNFVDLLALPATTPVAEAVAISPGGQWAEDVLDHINAARQVFALDPIMEQ